MRKKIAQNQNFVSFATFAKNISGFAQIAQKIAQNSLRFMRKNSAKVRKKNLRENSAKDLAISWKPKVFVNEKP